MNNNGYYRIPQRVFNDPDLSKSDVGIYGIIDWCEHMQGGICIMSNETLAAHLGVSTRSIRRGVALLHEKGYILATYKDARKRHRVSMSTIKDKFDGQTGPSLEGQDWPYSSLPLEIQEKSANMAKNKGKRDKSGYRLITDPEMLLQLDAKDVRWLVERTMASPEQIKAEAQKVHEWLKKHPDKQVIPDMLFRLEAWVKNAKRRNWLKPTNNGSEDLPAGEWSGGGYTTFVQGSGRSRTEYTVLTETLSMNVVTFEGQTYTMEEWKKLIESLSSNAS